MYAAMSGQLRVFNRAIIASLAVAASVACGGDSATPPPPVEETWDLTGRYDSVRSEVSCVTQSPGPCYSYSATDSALSGIVTILSGSLKTLTLNGRIYTWSGSSSTDGERFLNTDTQYAYLSGTLGSTSWSGRITWYNRGGPHADRFT